MKDLIEFINLANSINQFNYWIKKIYLISVDLKEIDGNQFNLKRYIIGWLHFIILSLGVFIAILFISNEWLLTLINGNKFLTNKYKIIAVLTILFNALFPIVIRFDLLMAEKNRNITVLKIFSYLQEDIKSRHCLTKENYKKFSILFKLLIFVSINMTVPFLTALFCCVYLFIAIVSNNILLRLITPIAFYFIWIAISTTLIGILTFSTIYYYILIFSQINDQINMIYKKSSIFINITNQKKLINLINKHNLTALQIKTLNLTLRRTICALFLIIGVGFVIPLNLITTSNNKFEKIFCISNLFSILVYGFCLSYIMSSLIRIVHKPYKATFKIFRRQNFIFNTMHNFKFKWAVNNQN